MFKQWSVDARQMGPARIISAVACGPATLAGVCIAGEIGKGRATTGEGTPKEM